MNLCCCASNGSGVNGTMLTGCFCNPVPSSISMALNESPCGDLLNSCTFEYGPTPEAFLDLEIGLNCFLSSDSFPDALAGGAMFQLLLTCSYNEWTVSAVYATSPFGSPYHGGLLYYWLSGAPGNNCSGGTVPSLSFTNGFDNTGGLCTATLSG